MLNRRLLRKVDLLLKKERGTVYKDPGGRLNICLCYPNTYHVGMSSLAFQGLYGMLNRRADVFCERAFLPDEEDIKEYERTSTPLFSLETKRPLNRFHLIAFSVSFENDYPNIVKMLQLARIPPLSRERTNKDPLLLLGGICATFNPEPLAEIFDLVFLGEAEGGIEPFLELCGRVAMKEKLLEKATRLRGLYVPSFYSVSYDKQGRIKERTALYEGTQDRIEVVRADTLDGTIRHTILTPETEFSDMVLVEAMRGCPWSCRFCLVGHIYRPVRHKPLEIVMKERGVHQRIGLVGPSLSDYRYIRETLQEGMETSITSVRASKRTLSLLGYLKGRRSISIAPETGSERLRRMINKRISEEEIIQVAEEAFKLGIESLRVYMMVGLPTEKVEDLDASVRLIKKIRGLSRRGTVVVSVSPFVPKPFTPFQWVGMQREEVLKQNLRYLKKTLSAEKGIRVFHEVVKYSLLQGLLCRGDRRLTDFLLRMNPGNWKKDLQATGVSEEFYLYRTRPFEEPLPWDFIDAGIRKETLWQEYMRAMEEAKDI